MLPSLDECRRQLAALIDERADQGGDVEELRKELAALPDSYDAMAALERRLALLPFRSPLSEQSGLSPLSPEQSGLPCPRPGPSEGTPPSKPAGPSGQWGGSSSTIAAGMGARSAANEGMGARSAGDAEAGGPAATTRRIWAMLALAVRRLCSQRGLTLASVLGVASAAVLVMSVPIYVDAAYRRLLREELMSKRMGQDRPPFSFMFHHIGSIVGPLRLEEMQTADSYFSAPLLADLGLPERLRVRSLRSDRFGLFPKEGANYKDALSRMANIRFGCLSDLQKHIRVSEGGFPAETAGAGPLDVLLSEALTFRMGLEVGEGFVAYASHDGKDYQIPLRIAGIWRANDPRESYWFTDPSTYDETLLMPEESFLSLVNRQLDGQVNEAVWYLLTDGSSIGTRQVVPLIGRIQRTQAVAESLLPRVIVSSPLDALLRYYGAERALSTHLYIFSIPIIGLNLIFTGLVAGMAVQRRRGEIAVLRSRGATSLQIVGVALCEGLIIGLLGLLLALPGSLWAAQLATRTRTFLGIGAQGGAAVSLNATTLKLGLVAIGFGLLTQVLPALGAARHSVVTYRQEQARLLRAPLWQRLGLDLLLLIPAAYGTYLLRQQGRLFVPQAGATTSDPFQNPLLVLVPSLTVLALTLLLIRILPLVVSGLAGLAAHTRSLSFLLAVRHLARIPGLYSAPLVLLITTLSLSVFLSATARTLDEHLYEQVRYQTGAEMIVGPAVQAPAPEEQASTGSQRGMNVPNWLEIPLADYLQVPGVRQAARTATFTASLPQTSVSGKSTLLAVDRAGLATVAFWSPGYAHESLGMLMNRLARARNAVLLPHSLMYENGLQSGDTLRIGSNIYGQDVELILQVAGGFDLFPTWNPQHGPLLVMNLDYLFESIGIELPSSLWLGLDPAADPEQVSAAIRRINPYGSIQRPYYGGIAAEASRPERQGLLGILSIGFLSAALLSAVGFVLYTLFSFRRRAVELGVLRSLGLSTLQLGRYLAWELIFLVLIGLAGGTGLGMLVSRLWIPYFRVGNESLAQILPMPVRLAWPAVLGVYGLFGLLLVAVLVLSVRHSRRLRLFEMVKIVETA